MGNEGITNLGNINSGSMAVGTGARASYFGIAEPSSRGPAPISANLPAAPPGTTAHRTILVVDVENFGNHARLDPHQAAVRAGLYDALRQVCERSAIPWQQCYHEDRGDGLFLLAGDAAPKSAFVTSLPFELAAALRQHNATHSDEARIRLRMSLHAGEIRHDDHGVVGTALNLAFRLLEAAELKSSLAASPGVLAYIVSSWFFDDVVKHSLASTPEAFRRVHVGVKETDTIGWIRLQGD